MNKEVHVSDNGKALLDACIEEVLESFSSELIACANNVEAMKQMNTTESSRVGQRRESKTNKRKASHQQGKEVTGLVMNYSESDQSSQLAGHAASSPLIYSTERSSGAGDQDTDEASLRALQVLEYDLPQSSSDRIEEEVDNTI